MLCKRCGNEFTPRDKRSKLCGSVKLRLGCSYYKNTKLLTGQVAKDLPSDTIKEV